MWWFALAACRWPWSSSDRAEEPDEPEPFEDSENDRTVETHSGRHSGSFTIPTPGCEFEPHDSALEGTWNFTPTVCLSGRYHPIHGDFCDEFTYTAWQDFDGAVTLEPGGHYVLDVARWTQVDLYAIPPECNRDGCAALGTRLDGDCVDDAGGCLCTISNDIPEPVERSGDWWVETSSGRTRLLLGTLYETTGPSAWLLAEYQVQGIELRLRDPFSNVMVLQR